MSDAIRKSKRVQHYAHNSDSFGFFNLLTRRELLDSVEVQLPAHRERLYPPTETLSMFLAQVMSADSSCRHIVNQAATQRLLGGLPLCSTSTGGYCRARERLPLPMVRDLARQTGGFVAAQWPDGERWRGRPVRLVEKTGKNRGLIKTGVRLTFIADRRLRYSRWSFSVIQLRRAARELSRCLRSDVGLNHASISENSSLTPIFSIFSDRRLRYSRWSFSVIQVRRSARALPRCLRSDVGLNHASVSENGSLTPILSV